MELNIVWLFSPILGEILPLLKARCLYHWPAVAGQRREPPQAAGGTLSLLHLCCPNHLLVTTSPTLYLYCFGVWQLYFFPLLFSGSKVIHVKAPSHFPQWLWVTVLALRKHFPILHWKQKWCTSWWNAFLFLMEKGWTQCFFHFPTWINYKTIQLKTLWLDLCHSDHNDVHVR